MAAGAFDSSAAEGDSGVDEPTRELVRAALEGDPEAWAKIDRRYRDVLALLKRGEVSRSSQGKFLTEDVVQSAMIRAFTALDTYQDRGPGSFGRWLRTIMENRLKTKLRTLHTAKREVSREEALSKESEGDGLSVISTTPDDLVARAEQMARITRALAGLPEQEKEIIVLTNLDHLTLRDAAKRLDLSESAARRRMAAAIKALSVSLADLEEELED